MGSDASTYSEEAGLDVEARQVPEDQLPELASAAPPVDRLHGGLHRGLSARQVSMIAIAGTIGTGLFLGTGKSLAQGGPASMLIWCATRIPVRCEALLMKGYQLCHCGSNRVCHSALAGRNGNAVSCSW